MYSSMYVQVWGNGCTFSSDTGFQLRNTNKRDKYHLSKLTANVSFLVVSLFTETGKRAADSAWVFTVYVLFTVSFQSHCQHTTHPFASHFKHHHSALFCSAGHEWNKKVHYAGLLHEITERLQQTAVSVKKTQKTTTNKQASKKQNQPPPCQNKL